MWPSEDRSNAELYSKIIRIADVCWDAYKSLSANPMEEKEILLDLVDAYDTVLTGEENWEVRCICTVLHRCGSMSKTMGQGGWLIKHRWYFLVTLLRFLQKNLELLGPKDISSMVWSLGCFGPGVKDQELGGRLTVTDLLYQIGVLCEARLQEFKPSHFSGLMVGLTNMDLRNYKLTSVLCSGFISGLGGCEARQIANVAWAIGKLGCPDGQIVIKKLGRWANFRVTEFTPQGLSNFLVGASKVQAKLSVEFVTRAASHIFSKKGELNQQDVSNTIWALAKLRFFPGNDALSLISHVDEKNMRQFKAQEISNLLYSCALFNEIPAVFAEASSAHIIKNHREFNTQELLNSGWSLALLGFLTLEVYSVMIERLLEVNGRDFEKSNGAGIYVSPRIRDDDLNQLYQCLLYFRYLSREGEAPIPIGLERACRRSWVAFSMLSPINYTVPKMMNVLSGMGVTGQPLALVTPLGIAINEVQLKGERYSLEIVGHANAFGNKPEKLLGPTLWRHKILSRLGIIPIIIHEDVWNEMDSHEQALYLQDVLMIGGDIHKPNV